MYLPETIIPPNQGARFGLAILTNQLIITRLQSLILVRALPMMCGGLYYLYLVPVATSLAWWCQNSVSGLGYRQELNLYTGHFCSTPEPASLSRCLEGTDQGSTVLSWGEEVLTRQDFRFMTGLDQTIYLT